MTTVNSAGRLTPALAELATAWRHPDREAAWDAAERAMVDTVAVALASRGDSTTRALLQGLGDDLAGGRGTVWVNAARGDSRTVALVNGTSAHALDFDDVDDQMIGHPSAVLVPTVLAVGEDLHASGEAVLDAYWSGLAVARALAAAVDIDAHYAAGWHSTGTLGAVAAAAAGCRLHGLDAGATRHALGIAGSLAAGSRQNFGTMTKPLHAGAAAGVGVLAARLAAAGFTADQDQLDAPLGYLALHAAAPGTRRADEMSIAELGLNVKRHACCYYIHAAADAMLDLCAGGLGPGRVKRVTVTGPAEGFAALIHHRPTTGLQGKFSMEYAMAACLLDGGLGLSSFTDEAVRREDARRLLELVELESSRVPPVGPAEWSWVYAVVTVETDDGSRVQRRVDRPLGHASRPLREDDLRAKYDDCLRYAGLLDERPADGADLYGALRRLRDARSVSDVTARLAELLDRAET